jgi:hypothetical protein
MPGKGLVTPSGDIHTWPTDSDGALHHAEYVDRYQPYQLNEGTAHFFKIRPRGGIDTKSYEIPANVIHHILKTVPSLRAGEKTDWHFAADEYDTRQYPDSRMLPPTIMQEPAQGKPHPDSRGCTCHEGDKLFCPVHGLYPDPTQQGYDHSWSIPEGFPVGYPQSQPKNYQVNTGSVFVFASDKTSEGSYSEERYDRKKSKDNGYQHRSDIISEGSNHYNGQTYKQSDERGTKQSADDRREADQDDGVGIDVDHDASIADCHCVCCLKKREEHQWHEDRRPDVAWAGLPRAEGAVA